MMGLMLLVLLTGCYMYTPYYPSSTTTTTTSATATLNLTSPTKVVYTSAPLLEYDASHDVSVTLNGALVTTTSGNYLSDSVTGLNDLVVTELDSSGDALTTSEVTFFLNDLASSDTEDFTSLDAEWVQTTTSGVDLIISDNLSVQGATAVAGLGEVYKSFDSSTVTKCVQAMDVSLVKNNNAFAAVGFLGTTGEMLAAKLTKTGSSTYVLSITEVSTLVSGGATTIDSETLTSITSGVAVRLYFYRNGAAYQACVADSSGTLLGTVNVASYSSVIYNAGRLSSRGIILCPYDAADNTTTMVMVDNYACAMK